MPVNISFLNSATYTYGNFQLVKLVLSAPGATSLSVKFGDIALPDEAIMYIYNKDKTYIHGPITAENIQDGLFVSETLAGSALILEVVSPVADPVQLDRITIDRISVGVTKNDYAHQLLKGYGDAAPCNQDAICNHLDAWDNQAAAVCVILINGTEGCTGALINTECNDLAPNVLTAEHCLEFVSNFNTLQFRFNYNNRICNNNSSSPTTSSYITYTGATLLASQNGSVGSDFALLQLSQSIRTQLGFRFAGWDRRNAIPPSATMIHHPNGDTKKISFENGPLTLSQNTRFFEFNMTPNANGDIGTLEGGSSGAPQFDVNRRIVGFILGGDPKFLSCTTTNSTNSNGRIFSAWTGGGTSATSLRTWPSNTGTTTFTNTIQPPSIVGASEVCSSVTQQYSIAARDNRTVSWSVSPANLVSSPTSSTSTTFNVTPTATASGLLTITATLNTGGPNCTPFSITKTVWLGKPSRPTLVLPSCITKQSNLNLQAQAGGASSYSWSFPTCSTLQSPNNINPNCWYNYTGNASSIFVYTGNQEGSISAFVSNSCGTNSSNRSITYCSGGGGTGPIYPIISPAAEAADGPQTVSVTVTPNPADVTATATVTGNRSMQVLTYRVFDMMGRLVEEGTDTNTHTITLDVATWAPGVYLMRVNNGDVQATGKFVVR